MNETAEKLAAITVALERCRYDPGIVAIGKDGTFTRLANPGIETEEFSAEFAGRLTPFRRHLYSDPRGCSIFYLEDGADPEGPAAAVMILLNNAFSGKEARDDGT